MPAIRSVLFVVTWSLVVSLTPIGLALRAPTGQPSSVPLEPRPDPSAPHGRWEQHDPLVMLRVRALVPENVTLSDPAQGTVRATVLTINEALNQIKVQTDAGQRLMVFLPPESLTRLRVGAPCLLQVANGTTRASARPPAPEEAVW